MTITLKGASQLDRKLATLRSAIPRKAGQGVKAAANSTRDLAASLARGSIGRAIREEPVEYGKGLVSRRVFNDTLQAPYSSYVEFGTGIHADTQGNSEAIRLKRAKSIPWYIHISMVPRSFSKYGFPLITGKDGEQFYVVFGTHPHPYMRPAAFQSRDDNVDQLANAVGALFREVF